MRKILIALLFLLLLIPTLMWLAWAFTPPTKLVAIIVDKTVLTTDGQEHISLNWVLNNKRYTKTQSQSYLGSRDYFGFFPLDNEAYEIKGLERFTFGQLEQLSEDADLIYITDTYGIYKNEWFTKEDEPEQYGMLYGGLSNDDLQILRLMKEKNKLIITEYNTIGSPTSSETRAEFEKEFKLKWTGWVARYFDNLDPKVNKELPQWLISNYKKSHNKWPFKEAGIVFIKETGEIMILEKGVHLKNPMPYIHSKDVAQKEFSLPEKMKYPFWFDIVVPDKRINEVISNFEINANEAGFKEMKKSGIPPTFPAITRHIGEDYSFYYLSGDFSDNPVSLNTSYFKGIGFFKGFFYNDRIPLERTSFFWKFYRPLIGGILGQYQEKLEERISY